MLRYAIAKNLLRGIGACRLNPGSVANGFLSRASSGVRGFSMKTPDDESGFVDFMKGDGSGGFGKFKRESKPKPAAENKKTANKGIVVQDGQEGIVEDPKPLLEQPEEIIIQPEPEQIAEHEPAKKEKISAEDSNKDSDKPEPKPVGFGRFNRRKSPKPVPKSEEIVEQDQEPKVKAKVTTEKPKKKSALSQPIEDFEEALRKSIEDIEKKAGEMHEEIKSEEKADPNPEKTDKPRSSGKFGKKNAEKKKMHVSNVESSSNNQKRQFKNENFDFLNKNSNKDNNSGSGGPEPNPNWPKLNMNTILFYMSVFMGYRLVSG